MSDFLTSLKADLLDRRLFPLLGLAVAALLGALAYLVLSGGGGSTSSPAAVVAVAAPSGVSGIAVSAAPSNPDQAIAETTDGTGHRHEGLARDPFAPPPGALKSTSSIIATPAPSTSSSSTSSGSTSSSSTSSGSTSSSSTTPSSSAPTSSTPSAPAAHKHSAPAKPMKAYDVAVLFGVAAAGTPPQSAQLTPYLDLKHHEVLPSSNQPLIVFSGVTASGKSARFTLVGEAILRGPGVCLPSASQCEAIELKTGQVQELEYIPAGGPSVNYELQVVGITPSDTSAKAASVGLRGDPKRGRGPLRSAGLGALLRYSHAGDVLVPDTHTGSTRNRPR